MAIYLNSIPATKHIKIKTGIKTSDVPKSGCSIINPIGTTRMQQATINRFLGFSFSLLLKYHARNKIKMILQNSEG